MPFPSLSQAFNIFVSFAITASEDKKHFDKLMTHLSVLKHQQLIDECFDSEISYGDDIIRIFEDYLKKVDIIVLLISDEFCASKRCYGFEMKRALELAEAGVAKVIPVILSPTHLENLPIARYEALPPGGRPISLWKDRDDAFSQVVRGIQQVIKTLTSQGKHRNPTPSHGPFLSLPYRRNRLFTNRDTIFESLSSSFRPKQGEVLALSGLNGMGKTQIALEYSYRFIQEYQIILWLNASSHEVFSTEVRLLADQLALPERDRMNDEQIFSAVQRWLQNQSEWLLVLDGLDDLPMMNQLVPIHNHGHVLLTTHTQITSGLVSLVPIAQMDIEANVLFFLKRANLLPRLTSNAQDSDKVVQQIRTLIQEMDGFPLALDQAAAYLEETGCDIATYLNLYQNERKALLDKRGQVIDQSHPESVQATLLLAFNRITNMDLLYLLAFLQPETIPEQLFIQGAPELEEPLQTLATHPFALHQALTSLLRSSLLQYGTNSGLFRIHRIIQIVLSEQLSPEQQQQWASTVVRVVNRVFPSGHFDTWHDCELYLPQAQHCSALIDRFHLASLEAAQLLQRLGSYCYRRGRYNEAKIYLDQSIRLYEEHSAGDTANAAQALNSLGLLSYRLALYQQAEGYHNRALALRKQVFGPDHLKTAESMHNLALLYGRLGKYQQAEEAYLHVLSLDERAERLDDPETARTLNSLGLIYYQQGKYQQAEEAYQRSLDIYEKASPDHPDLTYPVLGLGSILEKRGDYQKAEEHYQRAIALRKAKLGEEHPETTLSINKLGDLYENQGKDEQAEALYQNALTINEQKLGPKHPNVALFLNNIAFLANKHGDQPRAESLYQDALRIYKQSFGPESREFAAVLNNLGKLYQKTGDLERAEAFLRSALSIREQVLGADHPDTAQSRKNLADLLNP